MKIVDLVPIFILALSFLAALIVMLRILLNRSREKAILETELKEREKTEKVLRESEEKFSKVFRSSPYLVAITTLDEGRYIEVNDSYLRATGYSSEELIGRAAFDLNVWVNPEDRVRMYKILEEQGGVRNVQFDFRMKSGEIRAWLFSAEQIDIGGKRCLMGVSTDITENKKMEKTLAAESLRRRILIEQSRDGIVILDQDGKVYESNLRFAEMLGYSHDEVLRLSVWDWDTQWTREQHLETLKSKNGPSDHLETLHRRKDGSNVDVEISVNAATFEGQKLVFCVCRDITGRKQMERQSRESEEKFSIAFHSSPDIITISDFKSGVYIEVNDSFMRTTGYNREEIIGHHFEDLNLWTAPEDLQRMTSLMDNRGGFRNEEFNFRMRSGEIHTWLSSAYITPISGRQCLIAVATDITERMQIEKQLKESEERFSKAFRASPEPIAITSIKGGIFLEINDSYCRSTGFSREECIGHNSQEIGLWSSPEDMKRISQLLKKQGRVYSEEFQVRKKSGELRTWLFSAEEIDVASQPCFISVSTDITERKKAEDGMKQALARVAEANRELEAFSYSVSHDLRSPLRSIDGFSQALMEDYSDKIDETGRDYLRRLRHASQKMGELIDSILKLSRLTRSEIRREPVDLTAMAKEIIGSLQESQPERPVKCYIKPKVTTIGDPQLLRVLMENLLGNAWKFTGKTPDARIEFGISKKGEKETYYVKDNGAGFDMAYADKLFSAFQRLHDASEFPGTGIGLATVQRVVSRHGGAVRAEGKPGKGATFYFTLS